MLTSRIRRPDSWFDRNVKDSIEFFHDNILSEFDNLDSIGDNENRSDVFVPIDFIEKSNEYVIHAELPGVAKENIAVNIEASKNLLIISGISL